MSRRSLNPRCWHFELDRWLAPLLRPNFTYAFPSPISRFLGHRKTKSEDLGSILVAAWAFLGTVVGLAVISLVFMAPEIHRHSPPLLIASFGAAAVLEYNTINVPAAQPRNSIIGHFLSAVTGIIITKLFKLNPYFNNIRWLSGAISCGSASALMSLTQTVYPPGGATALLASVDPQVEQLGWYLLPLVLLSSVLMLVTSLLVNNIQRRFPVYWWTPSDLRKKSKEVDVEKEMRGAKRLPSDCGQVRHTEDISLPAMPVPSVSPRR